METVRLSWNARLLRVFTRAGFLTKPLTTNTLNLETKKAKVAAAEAEAHKRNGEVTACIVDESGALSCFRSGRSVVEHHPVLPEKGRHSAAFRLPTKAAADGLKNGTLAMLAFARTFPTQGGRPIEVHGLNIGRIACSGAESEVDEAIARLGLDVLNQLICGFPLRHLRRQPNCARSRYEHAIVTNFFISFIIFTQRI